MPIAKKKPRGKPFTKETAPRRGRPKGSKNKWTKADLTKLREHIQNVLDKRDGGIEGLLHEMVNNKAKLHMFVALLRDMSPKPVAETKVEAEVKVRWMSDDEEES